MYAEEGTMKRGIDIIFVCMLEIKGHRLTNVKNEYIEIALA